MLTLPIFSGASGAPHPSVPRHDEPRAPGNEAAIDSSMLLSIRRARRHFSRCVHISDFISASISIFTETMAQSFGLILARENKCRCAAKIENRPT